MGIPVEQQTNRMASAGTASSFDRRLQSAASRAPWELHIWPAAIALSLFGFQLVGAIADMVGMISPRPFSLTLRFGCGAAFLLIVLFVTAPNRSASARTALHVAAAFLTFYGTHLLIKSLLADQPLREPWYTYSGYFLTFSVLPFAAAARVGSSECFEALQKLLLALTSIVVILHLAMFDESALLLPRFAPFESVNPIGVGYAGLVACTLALCGLWSRVLSAPLALVAPVIAVSGATLSLLSGQRQVFVSAAATILLLAAHLIIANRKPQHLKMLLLAVALLSGGYAVVTFDVLTTPLDRILTTQERVIDGSEVRVELLLEALTLFLENPLIGGPIELPVSSDYPHNFVVEAFMASGAFGGIAFLCLNALLAFLALRLISTNLAWVGILFVQFAISSAVSGAIYAGVWFWTFAGLVIAADGIGTPLAGLVSNRRSLVQRVRPLLDASARQREAG